METDNEDNNIQLMIVINTTCHSLRVNARLG